MGVYRELSPAQKKSLAFLKSELSDGAREVRALQTLARTQGIYPQTLTASRKMLKIEVSRNGERGAYVWSLPKEKT